MRDKPKIMFYNAELRRINKHAYYLQVQDNTK